jgi:glutathione S-transferase
MKLYGNDLSPFVQRVKMQLAAKALEVEYLPPPGGLKSDAFLAINPIGKVPCLETDSGLSLPESEVIAEYLEDQFPKPVLRPRKPDERAKVRLLTRLTDIYLAPALTKCFRVFAPPRDAAAVEDAITDVNKALAYLEGFMSGKKHAAGNKFTTADCALTPILFFLVRITPILGVKNVLKPYKNLAKYMKSRAKDPISSQATAEIDAAIKARFGI